MNSDLIENLKKRKDTSLKVKAVYPGNQDYFAVKKFLSYQSFIDKNKIFTILEIIFLKDKPVGYALFDRENKIVGFLGTIYSLRESENKTFLHCYLHSWIVSKNYRLQTYRLILPIIEENIFISTFTPIKSLEGLYKKIGFKEKTINSKFILALGSLIFSSKEVKIVEDCTQYINILSKKNQRIFNDHNKTGVKKIFIYFGNDTTNHIFIIAKKTTKKKIIPFLDILYVSDNEKYKKFEHKINSSLIKKFKTFFLVENFINEENSNFSNNYILKKIKKKSIFYKNLPKNFEFNLLYSELVN